MKIELAAVLLVFAPLAANAARDFDAAADAAFRQHKPRHREPLRHTWG